jgi:Acetyltransferase (GNAT) domain
MSRILGKSDLVPPGEEGGADRAPVRAVRFTPQLAGDWDAFVERSRNGTLFHQRRFLAYHSEGRFLDDSLLLYRNDRLLAVYPAAVDAVDGDCWSVSHPGSSYGGPVVLTDASLADITGVVRAIVDHATAVGTVGLRMRLSEQAFRRLPSDEIEFVLWSLGFEPVANELSTTIALADGAEAARARYRSDTARSVRAAARNGVTVDWSDDYPTFWAILEENLQRHGARPTHTLAEIERLRALCGADQIRLALARVGGEAAAGIVVFVANPAVFHAFYIAHDYRHQQTRALSAVVDFLVGWGASTGYRWFNLGISTEARGRVVNWGLFRFKEGFGGSGFNRTTYALRAIGAKRAA